MNNKILYQQHIMWYESEMLEETLDSLQESLKYSKLEVELIFCLNSQTYIETPLLSKPEEMFNTFINHPIIKKSKIVYKTNKDDFYNIGDWRREVYNPEYKYTVWGESDCLVPEDYFYILSNLSIEEPHILTLASRIMWDDTWTVVEHRDLQQYEHTHSDSPRCPEAKPFRNHDYIGIQEVNEFNSKHDIHIGKLNTVKIDGSLLALSHGLTTPFIPEDLHFVREDYCAQEFFRLSRIPQYHISTRIKGHNYNHPKKRINTSSTRNDVKYKELEQKSYNAMIKFLSKVI